VRISGIMHGSKTAPHTCERTHLRPSDASNLRHRFLFWQPPEEILTKSVR